MNEEEDEWEREDKYKKVGRTTRSENMSQSKEVGRTERKEEHT